MTSIRLAEAFLGRARTRLQALLALRTEAEFSDVVREARDIVDLCFRSMLRIMDVEVSRWREAGEVLMENMRNLPPEVRAHEERLISIWHDLGQANECVLPDEEPPPSIQMNIADADSATSEAKWVLGMAESTVNIIGHRVPAAPMR